MAQMVRLALTSLLRKKYFTGRLTFWRFIKLHLNISVTEGHEPLHEFGNHIRPLF